VHTLVTTVLLGVPRFDALDANAEAKPPHGQLANSRHSAAIFSPARSLATNQSRSSTVQHSVPGTLLPPRKGQKCHLYVRNDL
jgi:hypothetical protein